MSLNLVKDGKFIFAKTVNQVRFWIDGLFEGEAGILGKSDVSIKAVPRTQELIDGSKYQLGYDLTFEIVSKQFYSAFEFDKLKNKKGFVYLPDVPLWIGTTVGGLIQFNVETDFNPGDGKGEVKISGSKYGEKLNHLIAPNWDGAVFAPFAVSQITEGGESLSMNIFSYDYELDIKNPLVQFVSPSEPTESSEIIEFKLIMLGDTKDVMEPLSTPPSGVTLKKFNGMSWVTVDSEEYGIVYESGIYKLHYLSEAAVGLGDKFRISFNRV